jgi:hypothetical protein
MVLNDCPEPDDRSPAGQTLAGYTLEQPVLFLSPQGRWRIAAQRDVCPSLSEANPRDLTTLWVWDATKTNWYFYAPLLDNAGALSSFVASKGHLDVGVRSLDPATGFWVNKP